MRIGRNEIVEELIEHMRKFGGEPGEWCAGVAETDSKFQIQGSRLKVQDSRLKISDSRFKRNTIQHKLLILLNALHDLLGASLGKVHHARVAGDLFQRGNHQCRLDIVVVVESFLDLV